MALNIERPHLNRGCVRECTQACTHVDIHYTDTEKTMGYCRDCGDNISQIYSNDPCTHEKIYENDDGTHICRACNKEIEVFTRNAEWRYYDQAGSAADPTRCHHAQVKTKSLEKSFSALNINIPLFYRKQIEQDYESFANGKTYRGTTRRAMIAICLFHAYARMGQYRTTDYICKMFQINRRDMSKRFRVYHERFPESRNVQIDPEHLVDWIFSLTGIDSKHRDNIIRILGYIKNTSKMINRSTPQSVANAAIYYYLCLCPTYKESLGLDKTTFAEKVFLSEITITTLVKEIERVTNIPIALAEN